MRIILSISLFMIVLAGLPLRGHAQPAIPREHIPKDIAPEVRQQIERLYSPDPIERAYAAHALGRMKENTDSAVDFLVQILDETPKLEWIARYESGPYHLSDTSPGKEAAEALGAIKSTRAVELLMKSLLDKDRNVRTNAAIALGIIGAPQSVPVLNTALNDQEDWVRYKVAEALGKIEDPSSVGPLIQALGDNYVWVRVEAARALGKIADARAIQPLIAALEKAATYDFVSIRRALIAHVSKHPNTAISLLLPEMENDSRDVRSTIVEALGYTANQLAVDPLVAALKDEDEKIRELAAGALVQLDIPITNSDAMDFLNASLKKPISNENSNLQRNTVKAMARIEIPNVIEHIIPLLNYEDWKIRFWAAKVLGELRDIRGVEPLIGALEDKDVDVRSNAAEALGKLADPRAVNHLIIALKDSQYHSPTSYLVRVNAAEALGRIKDPQSVAPLIFCLKDKNTHVAAASARALGELNDPRAIEPLIDVLGREYGVMKAADAALEKLTGRNIEVYEWRKWWEKK